MYFAICFLVKFTSDCRVWHYRSDEYKNWGTIATLNLNFMFSVNFWLSHSWREWIFFVLVKRNVLPQRDARRIYAFETEIDTLESFHVFIPREEQPKKFPFSYSKRENSVNPSIKFSNKMRCSLTFAALNETDFHARNKGDCKVSMQRSIWQTVSKNKFI